MARSRTFRIRLYCTACTLERVQILSMLMLPPSGTRSVHPGGFHETPPSLRFAHQVIRVDNLPQGPQFVSQANALVGAAFIDEKFFRDFGRPKAVEGIDYIIEPESGEVSATPWL